MTDRSIRWAIIGTSLIGVVALSSCTKSSEPDLPKERPSSVPVDAVRIPGPKVHWWARCDVPDDRHPHCQVFNARGLLLHDGVFIVHTPPGSFDSGGVKIAQENSDAEYLWLQDGRVLLPAENNTPSYRELIDDIAPGRNSILKR